MNVFSLILSVLFCILHNQRLLVLSFVKFFFNIVPVLFFPYFASMGGHGALICFLKNPGFYKVGKVTCHIY